MLMYDIVPSGSFAVRVRLNGLFVLDWLGMTLVAPIVGDLSLIVTVVVTELREPLLSMAVTLIATVLVS